MSRETILTDADGNTYSLDNLATQKWLEGHYGGLDQCRQWLDQRATVLFTERKYEQALSLQKLADEMKQDLRARMVKHAEEHEKQFPWRLSEVQQ